MAGKLRATYRLLLFVSVTSTLLLGYMLSQLVRPASLRRGLALRRRWMEIVPHRMGLRTRIVTPLPEHNGPVMYVSNHRSYLDPIMIGKMVEGVVIAKHEVLHWPLIGAANKAAGVVFVKREDADSRQAIKRTLKEVLQLGFNVLNYPEGTTSKSPQFLPFREGGFKVAAEVGCQVVPVAIEFDDPDDAWVDDDTFLRHFYQVFGKQRITASVAFGPPLQSSDHRALMQSAHDWIGRQLPALAPGSPANSLAP